MRKRLTNLFFLGILVLCACTVLCGCGDIWFDDAQNSEPSYHYVDEDGEQRLVTFTLELRQPSEQTETAENGFRYALTDGELIAAWEIPVFGNTLYESVQEYFKDKDDSFSFRASGRKYYMFHDCTLSDGTTYDLETVYIDIDGEYAFCANHQSLLGDDGVAGTDDDAQTVILVYRGWLS